MNMQTLITKFYANVVTRMQNDVIIALYITFYRRNENGNYQCV